MMEDMARDCTWTIATFLLAHERHELLVPWLEHMLQAGTGPCDFKLHVDSRDSGSPPA